jgi:hypothetical protein
MKRLTKNMKTKNSLFNPCVFSIFYEQVLPSTPFVFPGFPRAFAIDSSEDDLFFRGDDESLIPPSD